MWTRIRTVAAIFLTLMAFHAFAQQGQQGFVDQLRNQLSSEGARGAFSGPGAGAASMAPLQDANSPLSTAITNRSRLQTERTDPNADLQRTLRETQAKQLQQQINQLQQDSDNELTEFQRFLLQSTGKGLPIFGARLFSNVPSTFAPLADTPVTSDYVVGPGDEIVIRAWGQIDVDFQEVIAANGTVSVPKVGVIQVAGIKASDLSAYLKTIFSRTFRNFELTATLGKLRAIQVFVVGQAKRPGTYTVSAMSTLVTAAFASGGPSSKGSMRSIQLKRNNKIVGDFDLYDLLVSGDKAKDVQLLSGDVIYFPPVGPQVAVTGSVNVPAIYELKQNVPLFDLIRWAGGLSTTASGQKAVVERIEDRKVRKVEEFAMDANGLSKPVRDGDLVTVYALAPRFDNVISLRGNVAQPGRFPWKEGLRIRDLIPDREALLSRDYLLQRNQVVGLDDNVARILRQQSAAGTQLSVEELNEKRKPENQDNATIADTIRRMQTESEAVKFMDPNQSLISRQILRQQDAPRVQEQPRNEAMQFEATTTRSDALRLVNQIKPPQREVNWDYAVVERLNREDLSTTLVPFNLGMALLGEPTQNLLLQPGDIVTVFSKDDIQVPVSRKTKYVRLEGEFVNAGVYQVAPGETLRQLVARVGGFTPNAYLFGGQFTRESTRVEQQRNLDESINRLERDVQRFNIVRSQNVTTPEDAAALGQQAENQRQLVARLRQIKATGRIVLEVPPDGRINDLPALPLEDADRFYVPPPPSMVSVLGSVYSENSFVYKPEKRVSDYLTQAGGPTKSADEGSIYVLRADGSVVSKRQGGFLSVSLNNAFMMPGDSIIVPEELDRTTVMRGLKDFAQVFYQFGLGAAALKVLKD